MLPQGTLHCTTCHSGASRTEALQQARATTLFPRLSRSPAGTAPAMISELLDSFTNSLHAGMFTDVPSGVCLYHLITGHNPYGVGSLAWINAACMSNFGATSFSVDSQGNNEGNSVISFAIHICLMPHKLCLKSSWLTWNCVVSGHHSQKLATTWAATTLTPFQCLLATPDQPTRIMHPTVFFTWTSPVCSCQLLFLVHQTHPPDLGMVTQQTST